MITTAPRPAGLHAWRFRLVTRPAAVAEARGHVQAAVSAWQLSIDRAAAALLTSELVTNAIKREPAGGTVTLSIRRCQRQLRVDVHDTVRSFPVVTEVPAESETGRGMLLVAAMATEWGCYRTFTGKAVYFTLAFERPPDS